MTQKTIEISKLFYSFVPNCRGENYQDFLKGGEVVFRSFSYDN